MTNVRLLNLLLMLQKLCQVVRRPKAPTEYGTQLIEKQKIRFSYGISERQLSNYVKKATSVKGAGTADKLYEQLRISS